MREHQGGTWYHDDTPERVIAMLDRARYRGERIRLYYGDTETGRDWGDQYSVGYVGRSMGPKKIPILLPLTISTAGGGILCNSIVRISHANKKNGGDLYRHPRYHVVT